VPPSELLGGPVSNLLSSARDTDRGWLRVVPSESAPDAPSESGSEAPSTARSRQAQDVPDEDATQIYESTSTTAVTAAPRDPGIVDDPSTYASEVVSKRRLYPWAVAACAAAVIGAVVALQGDDDVSAQDTSEAQIKRAAATAPAVTVATDSSDTATADASTHKSAQPVAVASPANPNGTRSATLVPPTLAPPTLAPESSGDLPAGDAPPVAASTVPPPAPSSTAPPPPPPPPSDLDADLSNPYR